MQGASACGGPCGSRVSAFFLFEALESGWRRSGGERRHSLAAASALALMLVVAVCARSVLAQTVCACRLSN